MYWRTLKHRTHFRSSGLAKKSGRTGWFALPSTNILGPPVEKHPRGFPFDFSLPPPKKKKKKKKTLNGFNEPKEETHNKCALLWLLFFKQPTPSNQKSPKDQPRNSDKLPPAKFVTTLCNTKVTHLQLVRSPLIGGGLGFRV